MKKLLFLMGLLSVGLIKVAPVTLKVAPVTFRCHSNYPTQKLVTYTFTYTNTSGQSATKSVDLPQGFSSGPGITITDLSKMQSVKAVYLDKNSNKKQTTSASQGDVNKISAGNTYNIALSQAGNSLPISKFSKSTKPSQKIKIINNSRESVTLTFNYRNSGNPTVVKVKRGDTSDIISLRPEKLERIRTNLPYLNRSYLQQQQQSIVDIMNKNRGVHNYSLTIGVRGLTIEPS